MNEIIMNSRGDQGVVRSMIVGFEVCEAYYDPIPVHREPAMLIVILVNDKRIIFEVGETDEELKPLVEQFRKLFEEGDE